VRLERALDGAADQHIGGLDGIHGPQVYRSRCPESAIPLAPRAPRRQSEGKGVPPPCVHRFPYAH
jgi:hypothetical protein